MPTPIEPIPCSIKNQEGYVLIAVLHSASTAYVIAAGPDGSLGAYSIGVVKLDPIWMHNATLPVPTDQQGY